MFLIYGDMRVKRFIYLFYFNKKIKNLFIRYNNWIKFRLKVQKSQS